MKRPYIDDSGLDKLFIRWLAIAEWKKLLCINPVVDNLNFTFVRAEESRQLFCSDVALTDNLVARFADGFAEPLEEAMIPLRHFGERSETNDNVPAPPPPDNADKALFKQAQRREIGEHEDALNLAACDGPY
jgi:hypothetical protein